MYYVIGLGNPGKKYANTRHNVGWAVLDALAAEHQFTGLEAMRPYQANVCRGTLAEQVVWLVYPQTFMNRSGETVRAVLRDDPPAQILIVHDDVSLPVGQCRISYQRGHGGHNGVRSIFSLTKRKDFVRVRIGVAGTRWFSREPYVPTGSALPQHVLAPFSWRERSVCAVGITRGVSAVVSIVRDGVQVAMNEHNVRTE